MADAFSHSRRMALTWTWLALVVGIAAVVLAAIPGPLYRYDQITLFSAFNLIRYGAWTGIAAALAGLIGIVATLITRRWRMLGVALLALVLGLASFIWPYLLREQARSAPPIHTIVADPANPPQFVALAPVRRTTSNGLAYGGNPGGTMARAELGALKRFFASPAGKASPARESASEACRSWGPHCLAAVQHAYYPDIQPLETQASPAEAYAAALATAKAKGWKIVVADPAKRHIEATATTFWFGFKDDIAIDVTAVGAGSLVNIRSESRLGLSDLGTNARRVSAFLDSLRHRLGESSS